MDNIELNMWKIGRKKLIDLKSEFNGEELEELNNIIEATHMVNYKYKDKIYNMIKEFSKNLDEKKNKLKYLGRLNSTKNTSVSLLVLHTL